MKSTVERTNEEEVLKILSEQAPVGVCILQDGKFCYVNSNFPIAIGYTADELVGKDPLELIVPEDREIVKENEIKMLKGEFLSPYQFRVIHKDGSIRWVMEAVRSVQYHGRRAVLGNYMEVTERKQLEETLKESEERYRELANSITDIFFAMDEHLRYTYWNNASEILTGIRAEDVVGKSLREIFPDVPGTRNAEKVYREVLRTRQSQTFVNDFNINGRHYIFEISAYPSRGGISVFVKDITERKQAEEKLKESEQKYRLLFETSPDYIAQIDREGRYLAANPAAAKSLGVPLEELIGKTVFEVVPQEVAQHRLGNVRKVLDEWQPQIFEDERAGRYFYHIVIPTKISEHKEAAQVITRDVTERKQAEEALRQSEEKYRTILEEMEDAYFEVDLGGHFTFVNNSVCRDLGYSRKELIGMSYKGHTVEDDIESVFRVFNEVYRTGVPNKGFPWRTTRKDGSHGFAETSISLLRNDKGEIIGFRGVGRDISERRQMEEQLIVADRLASIGELASGIAHELNNPLTGIIGFSQLLAERNVPEEIKEDLKLINSEAQRAANVVKGLLTFARKHPPVRQLSNINDVIGKVLELRAYEQKVSNIETVINLAPDLPKIGADFFQLQQVFLNIVTNAEYFMLKAHNKGTLTITTGRLEDIVRISFTDDGPGISGKDLGHVFDPFFTTKEVGQGTGLGLSISHGIVTAHGGRIYAESKQGKGATFVVELPIGQEEGSYEKSH